MAVHNCCHLLREVLACSVARARAPGPLSHKPNSTRAAHSRQELGPKKMRTETGVVINENNIISVLHAGNKLAVSFYKLTAMEKTSKTGMLMGHGL